MSNDFAEECNLCHQENPRAEMVELVMDITIGQCFDIDEVPDKNRGSTWWFCKQTCADIEREEYRMIRGRTDEY